LDNLTHSLIGAALGQAGLKRKTGLAMPALIVGANIPDVDAACFLWLEGTEHLGFRRGITHGPPAMVLLPLLLAGALWWLDRWQATRGTRPEGRMPVDFRWLHLLGLIGCLSHPLFDWFNNYGVRLLEPFSSEWFYGDTLFIIDPWIIAMLGTGAWLSLRRERFKATDWQGPARFALIGLAGFVFVNMAISRMASSVAAGGTPHASVNVANPVPIAFWKRVVHWRSEDGHYGRLDCTALSCDRYPLIVRRTNMADPRVADWATGNPQATAFLFWSRMPIAEPGPKGILLKDQRFMDTPTRGTFELELAPKP
jgi:inner membrane protein